jgi:hypothetical protein
MIEVYKIIQGHYDPEASTIIKLMNDTEQRYRDRPFNLQGGVMVFYFDQKKNSGQHER